MRFTLHSAAVLAAAAALTVGAQLARADVVNGGFESGDFTGWTVSGDTGFTGVAEGIQHSGDFGAFFGELAPGSSISQTFATDPGVTYAVRFWLQLDDGAVPNSFAWSWNGAPQHTLSDVPTGFAYTEFSAFVVAVGTTTTLQFDFINPQSFWLLDDVSVEGVPEPAPLTLAAMGALALLGARRARGRSGG